MTSSEIVQTSITNERVLHHIKTIETNDTLFFHTTVTSYITVDEKSCRSSSYLCLPEGRHSISPYQIKFGHGENNVI